MKDAKRKGSNWERTVVDKLNKLIPTGIFRRIAGSGSFGTIMNDPYLMGDINGAIQGIPNKFKIEAKVGYGGSKQFTLKKEWLDKIAEEADLTLAIPMLVARFSGSRSGVENFVVMDIEVFAQLMNLLSRLYNDFQILGEFD